MPNYTELPERRYVEKAKNLSLGGKDSDTYFDGETLETMLTAIQDLQEKVNKKRYLHNVTVGDIIHAVIITDSATAFTKNTLAEWLRANNYTNDLLTGAKSYPTDVCIVPVKGGDNILSINYYRNLIVSQSGTIKFKSNLFAIDAGFNFSILDDQIKITTITQPVVVPTPNYKDLISTVSDTVIEV